MLLKYSICGPESTIGRSLLKKWLEIVTPGDPTFIHLTAAYTLPRLSKHCRQIQCIHRFYSLQEIKYQETIGEAYTCTEAVTEKF